MDLPIAGPIAIESLKLQLELDDELHLSGTLRTVSAQEEFARHVTRIHGHVVANKYPSFTVDVRGFTFVSSSAIRVFVNWISLADRARYKLVFRTERGVTWHRLSFAALKSLAPHTVEILDGPAGDGSSR